MSLAPRAVTIDGNEAAAAIAYHASELIAIYPITPAPSMGELADQWATEGRRNVWGTVPRVVEMHSEAGAAAVPHGGLRHDLHRFAGPAPHVAKSAAGGKPAAKKDLRLLLMTYGNVYVAAVALGADDMHTVKVFHDDLVHGLDQSRAAVHAGAWPLFRYDPRRRQDAKNPLQLDSKAPALPFRQYAYNGTRDTMLAHANPEAAAKALALAEADAQHRWRLYERLAAAPTEAP